MRLRKCSSGIATLSARLPKGGKFDSTELLVLLVTYAKPKILYFPVVGESF